MPRHRFVDTRDRIETAAIRLFVEKGVDETTVRDIAARGRDFGRRALSPFRQQGGIGLEALREALRRVCRRAPAAGGEANDHARQDGRDDPRLLPGARRRPDAVPVSAVRPARSARQAGARARRRRSRPFATCSTRRSHPGSCPTSAPTWPRRWCFGVVLQPVQFAPTGGCRRTMGSMLSAWSPPRGARCHGGLRGDVIMRSPLVRSYGAPLRAAVRHAVSRRVQRQPAEERARHLRDLPPRRQRRHRRRLAGRCSPAPCSSRRSSCSPAPRARSPIASTRRSIARWVKIAEIGIMALGALGALAGERAAAAGGAVLPRHAFDGLRTDQVRAAAAAPARGRAGRRQRPDRGRDVSRDSARHDHRRQRRADRPTARWSSAASASRARSSGWLAARLIPPAPPAPAPIAPRPRLLARLDRVVRHVDAPAEAAAAGAGHLLVLAVRRDRRRPGCRSLAKDVLFADEHVVTLMLALFAVGVGVGSILAERLLHGEVSARYVPVAAMRHGRLRDRSVLREQRPSPAADACGVGAFLAQAGQLADPRRSGRHRDGRRPVHRAALRRSFSTTASRHTLPRHRRQQHHQRRRHGRGHGIVGGPLIGHGMAVAPGVRPVRRRHVRGRSDRTLDACAAS